MNDGTLIGALAQLDNSESNNSATKQISDGTGWMVGPYVTGRINNTSLNYDLRAAFGKSDNAVKPKDVAKEKFETTREMVSGSLQGAANAWNGNDVSVSASLMYWKEKQKAFTNSAGKIIPSSESKLGESNIGVSLSRLYISPDGNSTRPSVGLSAVYNFEGLKNENPDEFSLGEGDIRGRVEAGLNAKRASGLSVNFSTFYDGIGIDDYESYGGMVRLTKPLN